MIRLFYRYSAAEAWQIEGPYTAPEANQRAAELRLAGYTVDLERW